jgi:hypothetical protein
MAYSDFTLADAQVAIDLDEYYINQIDKILAILLKPLRPEPVLAL